MPRLPGPAMTANGPTWDELCREYDDVRPLGRLWLDLTVEVCTRVAYRYPPAIYNNRLSWDESAIDDLAQDVVLNRLIGDHQIDYIVATASSVQAARGLIGMHVKQVLAQRAAPNQRENVAVRLYSVLKVRGEAVHTPNGDAIRPVGSNWPPSDLSASALAKAVRVIERLPRLPNRGVERLSPLYTTEVLEGAAEPLWEACRVPLSLESLRRILDQTLTGLIPVLFQLHEGFDTPSVTDLTAEERVLVDELAERLVKVLNDEQREILVNIAIMTDAELAKLLGVSRPTALKRRHRTRDLVSDFFGHPELTDLTNHQRGAVLIRAQTLLGGHDIA